MIEIVLCHKIFNLANIEMLSIGLDLYTNTHWLKICIQVLVLVAVGDSGRSLFCSWIFVSHGRELLLCYVLCVFCVLFKRLDQVMLHRNLGLTHYVWQPMPIGWKCHQNFSLKCQHFVPIFGFGTRTAFNRVQTLLLFHVEIVIFENFENL